MSGLKMGPALPAWLAAGIIGLAIGAAAGYETAALNARPSSGASSGGGGAPGGSGGGMRGGGAGGGASQEHAQLTALTRSIGGLATLEKAAGKELTSDQKQKVATIVTSLDGDAAMTDAQCGEKLKAIDDVLNPAQKQAIEDLTARPGGGGRGGAPGGGRGGAPGSGGPGSRMGGPPGSGGPGGGMGGMQAAPDYEHPFKAGRAHDRAQELKDLLAKG